jgi:antitoxin component YwqK of YwqJK toxin-antitoxin module
MRILFGFIYIIITSANIFAQDTISNVKDTAFIGITQYDRLCTIMGGDSVRYSSINKAVGVFKDYYPDGKLKHKGYYDNGQIVTLFTNYYESGQIEREFKAKSDVKGTLLVYYPNGVLMSRVEWNKGQSQKWEDFYPSGKLQFAEEYSRNFDHYLYTRFYFEDGKPNILFELTDEKNRTYSYKEYYENGQLEESGTKVMNRSLGDYQMDGIWYYYSEDGKLTLEEEYVRGQLINDKKH